MSAPTFRLLISTAVLALAAGLPAAAAAAAPWSAPAGVAGTSGPPASLWTSAAGRTALAAPQADGPGTTIAALAPSGAVERRTTVGLVDAMGVAYGQDRVAVAGATRDSDGTVGGRGGSAVVALGSASGDLGRLRTLATAPGSLPTSVAADARGDVAVVVSAGRRRTVFVRRSGGVAFTPALTLELSSQGRDAAVAVGRSGDVLVTWEDRHAVYARHLGPTGHAGPTHRLGDGVQDQLRPLVDDTGRLSVAWSTQRVGEGDAETPAVVRFATAAPGHGFGPQRTVSTVAGAGPGRYVSGPVVRLVADGRDRALLAFEGADGGRYVVRAMAVRQGHLGVAQTVSAPAEDSVLLDAAAAPGDAAVVAWRTGVAGADAPAGSGTNPPPIELHAAVRARDAAAFGPEETVSAPGSADVTEGFVTVVPGAAVVAAWGTVSSQTATSEAARPLP